MDMLLGEQDKQRPEGKKASATQVQCYSLGVWASGWWDSNGRLKPTLCLPLLVNLMHFFDVMSMNWSQGEVGGLRVVTEKNSGKAKNQLSWSQVNCISKPVLCFQCTLPFTGVIQHHVTNAIQLQSHNSYLWLAGHFGLRKAWPRRG